MLGRQPSVPALAVLYWTMSERDLMSVFERAER